MWVCGQRGIGAPWIRQWNLPTLFVRKLLEVTGAQNMVHLYKK